MRQKLTTKTVKTSNFPLNLNLDVEPTKHSLIDIPHDGFVVAFVRTRHAQPREEPNGESRRVHRVLGLLRVLLLRHLEVALHRTLLVVVTYLKTNSINHH